MKSNNKQKDAFLKAYDEYSDGLFRYALFKTSNRELALDIVQDTFTSVWEYIAKNGKIDNIRAFLYRTLNNRIIDSYRKKQSESLDNLINEGYDIGFDDRQKMEDLLMGESVWSKVTQMDKNHIEILTLRYMNDLSIKEIAQMLEQSENSVSVKIHRALEKLKEKLEHSLEAEGNIVVIYRDWVLIGKKLTYDLTTETGLIIEGKSSIGDWFFGGDQIALTPEKAFVMSKAFLTTVENEHAWWKISAAQLGIDKQYIAQANNIKLTFSQVPLLWFPKFQIDLKKGEEPAARYEFLWQQILKQRLSLRYKLYSSERMDLFTRLDYSFKYGPGGAIETDFCSLDKKTLWKSNNYAGLAKIVPQEIGIHRYRFQGLVASELTDKTDLYLSYDKLSDNEMVSGFEQPNFEMNTQKRTIFILQHQEPIFAGQLRIQPRINNFQSLKQELPSLNLGLKPLSWGGIVSTNSWKIEYLDYVFFQSLKSVLPSFHSARVSSYNALSKSFHTGPLTWSPEAGIKAIGYSHTPYGKSALQMDFSYGAKVESNWVRSFSSFRHLVNPYISFQGYSTPWKDLNQVYIFSLEDALYQLSSLRFGLLQKAFLPQTSLVPPCISLDIYARAFLGKTALPKTLPWVYTDLLLSFPSFRLATEVAYFLPYHTWDYFNSRLQTTINENVAFELNYRQRSWLSWKKSDPTNFILDVSTPISSLLNSPLSDKRSTLLAKLQAKLTPVWNCNIESHYGWGRIGQPNYIEFRVGFSALVTGRWKVDVGVAYDPANKWQGIMPSFKLTTSGF